MYYGPYTRLFYYLFGFDGDFEIQPQFHIPHLDCGPTEVAATFTVAYKNQPVMLLELMGANSDNDYERKEADRQIRDHFLSVRHRFVTPRVPAVSAFGTRLAFYDYVVGTKAITPPAIPVNPAHLTDVAPAEWGSCDLLEAAGFARLRQEVQGVAQMCKALG